MLKFNSLTACSSVSDPNNPYNRDVVDIFGIDESTGDVLQLHLEKDVWRRVRMQNPFADQATRFSGPVFASALNPDRVDLLGSGPKGEMLHCYTDPQLWYAETAKPDALPPNAQTTGGWWVWTYGGKSRLDLFSVTADKSAMVQYTAMDPGPSKDYTWIHNPLDNPVFFTDGPLTSCSDRPFRFDMFGVQAHGNAAQKFYMWSDGWGSNANLGAAYPAGTTLVSCGRKSFQIDVFGIDQNGKLLSFYWSVNNPWATRKWDMPVSGDWKLAAGCPRGPDQIDLFFTDAAGGILRVAVDYSTADPKLESELIYPFRLRQVDLDNFKKLFPQDQQLQQLTLDQIVQYSRGKDPGGNTAELSSDPARRSQRVQLPPCAEAIGTAVVDVFFLCLGWNTMIEKGKVAFREAIELGAEITLNDIEIYLRTIADASTSRSQKAFAIFHIGGLIYGGGLVEPIFKAIVKSLSWWDMVLYGVAGMAEISVAFLTDGAAFIAAIIYELTMAGFLVTDIVKAVEICTKSGTATANQPQLAN
jgi:hypothetical protein